MPVNPITKFNEPSGLTGEWEVGFEGRFWHAEGPAAVKFQIEKMTAILLDRVESDTSSISYFGEGPSPFHQKKLRIRLEASFPNRRLYSFKLDFKGPRNWIDEDKFLHEARRIFDYWTGKLEMASEDVSMPQASEERITADREAVLRAEAEEASKVVDQAPIVALQNKMLAEVKTGRFFRSCHKEGSNTLLYNGRRFMRNDEGEDPGQVLYETEEDFIKAVRNFYDWDSRRETYPHRPPEIEVWKYILRQLQ